jgi:hypothetical protein
MDADAMAVVWIRRAGRVPGKAEEASFAERGWP